MQLHQISHKKTGHFSQIIIDYLEGKKELKDFYKYDFSVEEIQKVINDKKKQNIDRESLVKVLQDQNEAFLDEYEELKLNIRALENDNCFTITTGHQLCIFGGPLYFITKIISVLSSCKMLNQKYSDYHFVPIFWMASEDHGRGEVSNVNLFGKQYSWEFDSKLPTGSLSANLVADIWNNLKEVLGDSDNARALIEIFQKAYEGTNSFADATRYYLTKLFGDKGLVILDGDHIALKEKFYPIGKEEFENKIGRDYVNTTSEKFKQLGYTPQVVPREINLFRIDADGRHPLTGNQKDFKSAELSPNVIYRPIYQELILPNLAYIGGPGEIAYWLQLKSLFDFHQVNFPMLMLRDNALLIPKSVSKKMQKLAISIDDLFTPYQELEKRLIRELSNTEIELTKELANVDIIFNSLKDKAELIDKSLVQSIDAERKKQIKVLEGIEKRLHKSEKRKQEESLKQLNFIFEKLFPNGSLQERYDNFMIYYLQYGHEFFEMLEKSFNVFNKQFVIIDEV